MASVLSRILFVLAVLAALYHSTLAVDANCENVKCPELLTCSFPHTSINFPDPNNPCCNKLVCTCQGTDNGKSSLSDAKYQYENTLFRYTNCTLVDGNLELVGFQHYAKVVDFTKHIEQVTGYVLIYSIYADYIDLSSLRLIRGTTQFVESEDCVNSNSSKSSANREKYSLYVNTNSKGKFGLKELRMPNLTEITDGSVSFENNDMLCYVETIAWNNDVFMDKSKQNVNYSYSSGKAPTCPPCPSSCNLRCWGNSTDLCQLITKSICDACGEENGRCFLKEGGNTQCCHGQCAAGCFGKGPKKCYACKKLNENGTCVQNCLPTEKLNPNTQQIEKISDDEKYQYAQYCVKKCPDNVPQTRRFCQTFCEEGTFDYENNICTECKGGVCKNICYGLGLNHGPLKGHTSINSNNIKYFNKNCTIIEGSLYFQGVTFVGDNYCKIAEMKSLEYYEVFENVEEITGFLAIESWLFKNMCIFKNLRKIRGKVLQYQRYALAIYTKESHIKNLCLNSLETIGNGAVLVLNNSMLCTPNSNQWDRFIVKSSTKELNGIFTNRVEGNKDISQCAPCALQCNETDGCWGPLNTQCIRCNDYTDLTDSAGKLTPQWVLDASAAIYPGHNVTTCVEECDFSKGVYPSAEKTCLPCDSQCVHTCVGPGPAYCTECKSVKLNNTCMEECPVNTYYKDNNDTCQQCGSGCIDGGCKGPLDEYDINNGCLSCHHSYDAENNRNVYRGSQCKECLALRMEQECPDGCYTAAANNTQPFHCIILPRPNYGILIGVPLSLLVLVGICCFLFYYYRNKQKVEKMKRTITDKMTGEPIIDEEESMPLTPSGAAPNQAQLRIVKDSELVMGKLLGSGAFGAVHKAIWTPLNIQGEKIKIAVAVKTLKTPEEMTQLANNEIMDEAYVMASVSGGYLVRLLGIRMTEHVSLITQLMPLGSLLEYVRAPKNQEVIYSRQMLTWFVQIAKGMQYLAEKNLVHRDLAARNVLMKTHNHVKITDFGLAKMLDVKQDTYHAEGGKLPIKWLAIECITQREFSSLSDVWAYGVTCWELLTFGSTPYEGVRAMEVLSLLERGDRLPQPSSATLNVYLLLVKCWMVDRRSRPTFKDLVSEFGRMMSDPTRYVVLKNDSCHGLMSPNPMDEDRFFRQLMEDEEVDDTVITDEADQYLFTNGDHAQPHYVNQKVVNETNNTHPAFSGPERLFSRSTPSAHADPLASSSTSTERQRGSDIDVTRVNSISDQDDVFSESAHSSKHFDRGHLLAHAQNPRKDSEETQRYTEDPTTKRMVDVTSNKHPEKRTKSTFSYDEDQYLLPTPNKVPGLTDGATSLMNDTYIDSPPLSVAPSHTSEHDYSQLSNCREQKEPEYVNSGESESFPQTWFSNEEYMATDSGIGEDSQSLLSRGNTGKRGARKESGRSSTGDSDQLVMKNAQVQFRPRRPDINDKADVKLLSTSSDSSSPRSPETSINNPEYMFLNASTSNNKPSFETTSSTDAL